MAHEPKITSKGQVTIPVEVRRRLGLRRGDRVQFTQNGAEITISRASDRENPFDKYIGILKGKRKHAIGAKEWMAELRDEE
ncbi:MAG TPA: type II toxin-antitoxin system PrlF family antitoxin [Terriglobales bacterium]|nr:type II toxin-antitoxin system PrlF family antitoxin [Terriglobales bacterium]